MDALRSEVTALREENKQLRTQIKKQPEQPLQKEVLTTLNRNKKGIIKQKILELIEEQRHSIPEIKDIIVDQQSYCSKASFYRYIDEIKTKQSFREVEVNDKLILVR